MAQRVTLNETRDSELPVSLTKEVFDYFAGELFEQADTNIQEFLLHTAFFDKMTVRNVEGLTGQDQARLILDGLVYQGYYTEKHGETEAVYQYHSLFRQFLLHQAEATWRPAKLAQVQRRVGIQLEKDGQLEEAAAAYKAIGDWAGLARLVLKQAQSLIAQGRNETLEDWLISLPSAVIEKDPWLLYWQGICRLLFNPPLSRESLDLAFKKFTKRGDDTGSLLAWSGIVNSILIEWGDFSRLDQWVDWLDQRMHKNSRFPSSEIEARAVCDMVQSLVFRRLDHPQIHIWMERGASVFRKGSEPNLRLQIATALTNYYMWSGQFRSAREMVKEIQKISRSPGVGPMAMIQAKTCAAMFICVDTTSPDPTLVVVSETITLARTNGINLLLGPIYAAAFYAYLNTGDFKSAEEYLEKVKDATNNNLLSDLGFYNLLCALFALCQGEADHALHYAKKAHDIMVRIGFPVGEAATGVALAQALHEYGEHQKAKKQLSITIRTSLCINSKIYHYIGLLTEAQIEFDAGSAVSESRGLKALRKAMQIGREQDFISMPGWRAAFMSRLCAKALEHQIEPDYVNHLIRTRGLIPNASLAGAEHWPWPIKIYTLGRFSVVRDGEPLRLAKRGQGKVIDLLKALIAHGSRGVDEARLADCLWTDAEGDKAHQAFRTTLHRLRKFLGNDEIFSVQDGGVTLDPRYCWVDVWAFERHLGKGDTISSEKAVALYQGRFLERATELSWAVPLREHLHARYLACVSDQGHRWEAAGEWRKAAACYKRGLAVDPLVEEYYQRLMICHQRLGHRAEAVATYKRCCEMLRSQLDLPPAPETEKIARELREC